MDINPCSVDDAAAPRASRITHLDGLRGWFCIQVMLSHIAFPWPQELNVFSEGVFGVMVFFALSGFALSAINQPQQMVRFALGRYL